MYLDEAYSDIPMLRRRLYRMYVSYSNNFKVRECFFTVTFKFVWGVCVYGGTLLVAQLVEALRYKPEGRGFDFRWCL